MIERSNPCQGWPDLRRVPQPLLPPQTKRGLYPAHAKSTPAQEPISLTSLPRRARLLKGRFQLVQRGRHGGLVDELACGRTKASV